MEIREIRSGVLTHEQVTELDGAAVFDPDSLDMAILTVHEGRAVYGYERLVELFACEFEENESREDAELGAVEWVDYNVVRAVPYMGARRPFIVLEQFEPDFVNSPDELLGHYLKVIE